LEHFEEKLYKITCQKQVKPGSGTMISDLACSGSESRTLDGIRTWNSKVLGAPQRVQGGGLASGRLLVQRRGAPRRQ
jgi:hypothetical protein